MNNLGTFFFLSLFYLFHVLCTFQFPSTSKDLGYFQCSREYPSLIKKQTFLNKTAFLSLSSLDLFRLGWVSLAHGDTLVSQQLWEAEWHPIHTYQVFSKTEHFNWIPRQLVWVLEIHHWLWVASWEQYMCVYSGGVCVWQGGACMYVCIFFPLPLHGSA